MQRPHEWKADMLTLRDLGINWQRYARISKQKTGVRIKNNIMVSTEVSRGHSKPATSSAKAGKTHKRTKDQMLEWRSKQEVYGISYNNRNTLANCLYEDKPQAESKIQEELSRAKQTMRATPGRKFFLVVVVLCWKKS